jgi:4-amino-4-deoxy-L-arabinose transferase-like glycosyltransferase
MTRERTVTVMAFAWVAFFVGVFFFQTLPNNPISRITIFREVPIRVLDWIAPLADRNAPPAGWRFLPQRFAIMAAGFFVLAGIWGCGHLLLRWIRPGIKSRCAERTVFAFGLGYTAFSLLCLGLGLAGMMNRWVWILVIAASALAELALQLNPATRRRLEPDSTGQGDLIHRPLFYACMLVMACLVLTMLFGAMSPSRDFDVREYHLQGPKEWLQNGQVTFLEHNVYTSFPFLSEMLTLIGMIVRADWWEGALVGKLVLMSFAPLSALAVFAVGRRWFGATVGLLAATIHLTTPWTYRISIIAYSEGALTFFLIAALLAIGMVVEKRLSFEDRSPLAFVAGLLAGSAMASKYPGVISVVIPLGGVLCVCWLKRRDRTTLKWMFAFAVGVCLTVGPWLAKNRVQTGNPVYPLVYSVFGGVDWDAALDARWQKAHGPDHHKLSDLGRKALDVAIYSDWQSPLLFAFAPLALLNTRRRPAILLWLFVLWLFLTWWLLTHRIDRFWVPMIPVVCILAGAGMASRAEVAWRRYVGVVFVAVIGFNFVLSTSGLGGYNAWLTDLYDARQSSTKAGLRILNARLPEDARVLCVGEAEVFDAEFDLLYNTVFDECLLQRWATDENGQLDPDRLRQRLKDEQITHIYVNWQEILRYRLPGSYQYTDFVSKRLFETLRRQEIVEPPIRLLLYAYGVLPFEQLDRNSRSEVKAWSLELMTGSPPTFIRAELYTVVRDE